VARWHSTEPPHVEPPEWYRNYHPEDWDLIGPEEQAMIDGSLGHAAPDLPGWAEFHGMHAERRWKLAKYAYRQQHPDLAEQEFNEILSRRPVRRAQPDL
jgi:hypothetical protein